MGFFSDIINDARRPVTSTFQTSGGPDHTMIETAPFDDAGSGVTDLTLNQWSGRATAVSPSQFFTGHKNRNLDDHIRSMPLPTAVKSQSENGRFMPDQKNVVAKTNLDSIASFATAVSHAADAGQADAGQADVGQAEPGVTPNKVHRHTGAKPEGFFHHAVAGAGADGQFETADRVVIEPDATSVNHGRSIEQEQRGAAVPEFSRDNGSKAATHARVDASIETVDGARTDSVSAKEGMSPLDRVENSHVPPQEHAKANQEHVKANNVESRPVISAPVTIDVAPTRGFKQHNDAATNERPQVHIGHIDIIVSAPEPARTPQSPASALTGLVNRHYLRRL